MARDRGSKSGGPQSGVTRRSLLIGAGGSAVLPALAKAAKPFGHYGLEQQAEIVAHYFLRRHEAATGGEVKALGNLLPFKSTR